jgi:hypothetical protein
MSRHVGISYRDNSLDPGASYGEAYFADEANGYCVLIGGVGVAGRGVVVFAVADRKTVYPISCDDVIYRYAEKDGKKGIFPNENGQDSPHGNLAKMGFSSVSDWIFEGLSGKACPLTMSNTIYYRDE